MCAKKEITKSNVITFSTWYDIKPVVVMPKMKITFKKCRSVSLNRLKKQNKLNVQNKKPDQKCSSPSAPVQRNSPRKQSWKINPTTVQTLSSPPGPNCMKKL